MSEGTRFARADATGDPPMTADAEVSIDCASMTARNRAKLVWAVMTGRRLTMNVRAARFHCTCLNNLGALIEAARLANAPASPEPCAGATS